MNDRKQSLQEAIRAVKNDMPTAEQAAEVTARVWDRMYSAPLPEKIRGCADVQSLAPAYHRGALPAARRLLVSDHLKECAECRRVYAAGSPRSSLGWSRASVPSAGFGLSAGWAMAAAVTLAAGIAAPWVWKQYNAAPERARLTVQSVDGLLVRVSDTGERSLQAGDNVEGGWQIRTAGNSHAFVRLADGSVLELGERAQLAVRADRRDTTVDLDRSNIIVQADKRKTGHLYVQAPDCRVAVTGTVFAVNRGLKGSRVSVVEGEVHVAQAGQDKVLHSGDQAVTTPALQHTPVRDEIAWSQNRDQHWALLAEFHALQQKLEQVQMPGLRYQSRLLQRLPADTVVFASIPNLGGALGQAQQLFEERLQESAALRDWWQRTGSADKLPKLVSQLRTASEYLGDEIVIAGLPDASGKLGAPLILAQVVKPGLQEFLAANAPKELPVSFSSDLMMITPGRTRAPLLADGAGGLAQTDFGKRIAQVYQDGAGILLAADMSVLARQSDAPKVSVVSDALANVRYLVIERKDVNGQTQNRADLAFSGPRQGLASWLGAAGPMGALQFVSPSASVVSAAIVKSPSAMLSDVLQSSGGADGKGLAAIEEALRLNIQQDVAAPLGTELLFAFDGPVLPTPSWKLVVEVNDAGRLQHSISSIVERINDQARQSGQKGAHITQEQVNGRTYWTVASLDQVLAEAHYTFTDGYLIAAPTAALVTKAIQTRDSGMTLARSERFLALLPADRHANFSALVYHDLGPLASTVAGELRGSGAITPERKRTIDALTSDAKPSLVYAYGDQDRIQVASARDFFGLDLKTLLLGGLSSGFGSNKASGTSVH